MNKKSQVGSGGRLLENGAFSLCGLDKKITDISPGEIITFCCVRNELLRLPYFLEYHRALGVDRFIFVDNASDDGTVDFLLAEKDVHVFYTEESYAKSRCGVDWLNSLLMEFGVGHWTLTLDADELLVYPMCEHGNLRAFISYLESVNAEALQTFLLDMYSDKPIRETFYTKGESFTSVCNYFDSDTYHLRGANGIPIRGGPRHRLFWRGKDNPKPSPVLGKVPLVKWREDLSFTASTHNLSGVKLAPITGVLQHFKLFSDFITLIEIETRRKEHWDNAAQYEIYWGELKSNPVLTAFCENSIAYIDSMQLVELGLISCPDHFPDLLGSQID